jgi:protein-disulfide isomerase
MKHGTTSSIPKAKLTVPMADRDHIAGPIDAPATLVEYGDYECPYCGSAHPIVKAIQKRLGERLCFAFRNFPLTHAHPHAEHAAEAAESAAAQGRFWEMHDLIFENQSALEDEDLAEYASTLGLNSERLLSEVQAGTHVDRIRADYQAGASSGVNGTPTFFINGVLYEEEPEVQGMVAALTGRSSVK